MSLELSVVGLVPAALVVLSGAYVRARQADGKLARRWLFFLFSVSVLLFGTQFLIQRWEMYKFGAFLQPALVGTVVALLVHLGTTRELWSRETITPPKAFEASRVSPGSCLCGNRSRFRPQSVRYGTLA